MDGGRVAAPGPECVWEAETMSVAGTVPDAARRSWSALVKARSTAIRSSVTHTTREVRFWSTSARAPTGSCSPADGLNQHA